ncbi:OLC1v1026630C1 [Oldenlandia corymbosa var. corymbosa]|uniref:OLC1v1026630C1 n=1 Tax=Oldenlandia corymbosa var. corymbosa TaxID=529605 RepID=A0AAV1C7X8_OLDCO|nr:OLC1v1026630C1 [Oldenlandia corymbosa var. corymbosa]
MALTNTLRRAASRVAPLAARAFQGGAPICNKFHTSSSSSALFAAVNCRISLSGTFFKCSSPSALRHFSARSSSDQNLIKVLEDEIRFAEESDENLKNSDAVEQITDNFPFKLEDNPGQQTVTLKREYQGEQIIVEVHMPSAVTGEYDDEDREDRDDDNNGAEPHQLPLVVRISKKDGPCLEFGCTAGSDEILIDSLSVKDPNSPEDQIAYEGPDFSDLDENLQKAFKKYLEIRGVKPSTTNYMLEYMVNKDSREYHLWLKNLKKFVEA